MEFEKLICCTETEISSFGFFFFFAQFSAQLPPTPPKKKEWRGTHALSLTYKLHNFKTLSCCFSTKWKCFYLRSLRHIIVPLACFLQSETEVFLFSLCLCFFFLFFFSIYKRSCCKAIAVTCTGFLYVAPLPSSKCLTSLKGLPLVLWPAVIKSYVNGFIILSEFRFLIGPVHSCQSGGGEEDAVDDANTTQRSGLLAAAQPIKRGRAQSLLLVFSFLIILLLLFF